MAAALLALVTSATPAPRLLAALPARPVPDGLPSPAVEMASRTPTTGLAIGAAGLDPFDRDAPASARQLGTAADATATAPSFSAVRTAATAALPVVVVRAAARPRALWTQLRSGLTLTGVATWYETTRGYADVPHVAMPGARYLPRGTSAPRARVCVDGRCAVLPVVDYCGCHLGTDQARLVDLSAAALVRLGLDPREGIYRVRVTLITG